MPRTSSGIEHPPCCSRRGWHGVYYINWMYGMKLCILFLYVEKKKNNIELALLVWSYHLHLGSVDFSLFHHYLYRVCTANLFFFFFDKERREPKSTELSIKVWFAKPLIQEYWHHWPLSSTLFPIIITQF